MASHTTFFTLGPTSTSSTAKHHHDHVLTGDWKGFRDCHIHPDLALIYIASPRQTHSSNWLPQRALQTVSLVIRTTQPAYRASPCPFRCDRGIVLHLTRPANVQQLRSPRHQHPPNQQPPMTVIRILLRAHNRHPKPIRPTLQPSYPL